MGILLLAAALVASASGDTMQRMAMTQDFSSVGYTVPSAPPKPPLNVKVERVVCSIVFVCAFEGPRTIPAEASF